MTDDLLTHFRSDVPSPDKATAQRVYARATTGRRHLPRRKFVLAVAATGTLLAVGLSFAFVPGSPSAPHSNPSNAILGLTMTPDSQEIGSSVGVEVRSPVSDASLQLQVLRAANEPGTDPNSKATEVVFEETVPMTNAAPAGQGSPLSIWSGTLSPSDWNGGCQSNAIYTIKATVLDSSGAPAALNGSRWFSCSQATS